MAEPAGGLQALPFEEVLGAIRGAAEELALETYLVGGFVRDGILGRPGKDVDILTVGAPGIPLLEMVARRLGWSRPQVFERFGTGQVRGGGWILEVVQARSESYDPASRRPDVAPGTLDEDILRRDFTVNALCQTLDGEIVDRTGRGLDDLRDGVLRTPLDPHETFSEDPLRMFRAARFVAQLNFTPADGVLEAIREEAHRASILSIERISEEFRRLLICTYPRRGLEILRDGGLFDVIMPEAMEMAGVEQGGWHIYDVFDHTTHAVEDSPAELITRAAAFFHDIGKPRTHAIGAEGKHTFYNHAEVGAAMAEEILGRFRFSNDEVSAIARLVRMHLRPIQYQAATHGDSAVRRLIRDAGDLRPALLDLARADTRASSFPNLDNIDELEERMGSLDRGGEVSHLVAPLDGHEIMRLGHRPAGRWVGTVMRALENAVLEGEIPAADEDAARGWLAAHPELLVAE